MREYLKKHKHLISITAVILVLVALSVGLLVGINLKNKTTTGKNNSDEEITFNFYERDVQKIADAKDMGVMLLACDKEDEFGLLKNGWITRESGEYVQGTGALIAGSMQRYSSMEGLFRRVDISEYETGSLHLSMFVSEPDKIGTGITLEFSSSGSYDLDEMSWTIPAVALESGWNELYLSIPDAVKAGEIDFTGVNYFRLRTPETKVGVTLIIDNVYATDTEASSLDALRKPVAASTKSGYLMDCDTLSGLKKNDSCILSINEAGGHKEGKGALAINNFNYVSADLQEADISAYKDGNLCFWLYVNDKEYIKDVALRVELTSSGIQDIEELSWVVSGSGLKTGWNSICLSLASAGRTVEDIDLTKVNFFRIWTTNAPKSLMMFLDAVHMEHMSTRIATDGKIADCDSLSGMSVQGWGGVFNLTSEKNEFKEGTGAVKGVFEKDHPIQMEFNLFEYVDISSYADGSLRFWLYVDDISKLGGDIRVELSSAGQDILEHQWGINKNSLTNGWNEIVLNFAAAGKSADGGANFNKICRFRLYVSEKSTDKVTFIVDDIRAEHMSTRVATDGKVLSCDSLLETGVQGWGGTFDITSKAGEYKEGNGAIKGVFEKDNPMQMELNFYEYVDISAYSEGSLKFWLYVDDVSKLGGDIRVELSSAGQDTLEHQWGVLKEDLNNGWNELNLRFSDAGKSADGGVDFSKVSRFRLYITEKSKGELTFILDDIRVAEKPPKPAPVPGMILSCDDTDGVTITGADNYSITTKEGEYKEGTGAFKSKGTGPWRWCEAILDNPMDLSEYADGSLHMWLYVEDVTKLKANAMKIQLGSGGAADTDVHQWSVALESGWNELNLEFANAELKNADLSKINYFRIWRPANEVITVIVDDVRVIPGEEEEPSEPVPGMILSFDNANGVTIQGAENNGITTTDGEYKEGTGAFKSTGTGPWRWCEAILDNPMDISEYADGSLHMWLYVEDVAKLKANSMKIQLGSGGAADTDVHQWSLALESGWNELTLNFADAELKNADLSKINYFRLWRPANEDITVIVDDVRAVAGEEPDDPQPVEPIPGMILSCDGTDGVTIQGAENNGITTTAGEFKEGTGAFKSTGAGSWRWCEVVWSEALDLSEYENGSLHMWLYVEDVTKLQVNSMKIQLGSGGAPDTDVYQWSLALENGWNELNLVFSKADLKNGDLSKINYFRILRPANEAITVIVDDVRAVAGEESQPAAGMLWSCDNTEGATITGAESFSITTTAGEYKEGTGAFKSTGTGPWRWCEAIWSEALDLSEYENGSLHMWLYVEDVAKLKANSMKIQLGSGGAADVDRHQWSLALQNGWNELTLDFADAEVKDADFTKINYFRIWRPANESITVIVDDVRVVAGAEPQPAAGMLWSCDNTEGATITGAENSSITTTAGEYKEGTGAFKSTGTGPWRWCETIWSEALDLSEYENGSLHMWLYVEDVTKLKANSMKIQLGSGGAADVDRHQWSLALQNGWNELTLDFADAEVKDADFSKINYFRIWRPANETTVVIVDDVRVIK